jgi:uncharacterized protein (TIGR03437 family)
MGLGRSVCAALILQFAAHSQTGIVTTIAGRTGVSGYGGDGGPAVDATLALGHVRNEPPCDPAILEQPSHISVDAEGNVYIADSNNHRVRRIDPAGIITTVAGTGEAVSGCQQLPESPRLFGPADVIKDRDGSLIIADQRNNRIRRLSPSGALTTIVGNGQHFPYNPGQLGTNSPMDWPSALALDANGILYFAELHTHRIAMLGRDGRLSTAVDLPAGLRKPAGIAIDRTGALLIADTGSHRVRRFANGVLTTIAGRVGAPPFCGDNGPAVDACLSNPMDVKADALGNIYIADSGNHRVRRIDPSGIITTIAGTGEVGRGADGVAANTSAFNAPSALAVDSKNDLYIVDWLNYLIRKVTFGAVPTVAAGGIVNAASFTAPIAPGSLISIFGSNLEGGTVEVNGVAAPLIVVTPGQINAQLPYETVAGTASVAVTTPAGRSAPATATVVPESVGVFTFPGTDRAIAEPVAPRGVLVLYVTGLGAATPTVATGRLAPVDTLSFALTTPTVTIGGLPADVQFAGLAPGFIGLGQMNIGVPAGVPPGEAVPVVIQGAKAVTVTIR